jgi:hypothetical protein
MTAQRALRVLTSLGLLFVTSLVGAESASDFSPLRTRVLELGTRTERAKLGDVSLVLGVDRELATVSSALLLTPAVADGFCAAHSALLAARGGRCHEAPASSSSRELTLELPASELETLLWICSRMLNARTPGSPAVLALIGAFEADSALETLREFSAPAPLAAPTVANSGVPALEVDGEDREPLARELRIGPSKTPSAPEPALEIALLALAGGDDSNGPRYGFVVELTRSASYDSVTRSVKRELSALSRTKLDAATLLRAKKRSLLGKLVAFDAPEPRALLLARQEARTGDARSVFRSWLATLDLGVDPVTLALSQYFSESNLTFEPGPEPKRGQP